jgi:hypothetical protein
MLTLMQLQTQRRRRQLPSLKQQHQAYILQRIEAFKNSIPREELLRIGDEAVAELDATVLGQFVLTEVLMQDTVDRMISRRLGLPSYRRWSQQFKALRAAQREPTHWGIDARSPIAEVLPRIEPGDGALIIGAGAEPFAYLLGAHEVEITFIAGELNCVERVEDRVIAESLGATFNAFVADLAQWLPPLEHTPHCVVIEASVLEQLSPGRRRSLVQELQELTPAGGVHIMVPNEGAMAPEAFLSLYSEWTRTQARAARRKSATLRSLGVLLLKPACDSDTEEYVSETNTLFGGTG